MAQEQIKSLLLKELLIENRDTFNSTFQFYRYNSPNLKGEDVFSYIVKLIDPFFVKNAGIAKERAAEVLNIFYRKLLELLSKEIFSNSAKYPQFEFLFSVLLNKYNEFALNRTEEFLASVSNALIKLGGEKEELLISWSGEILNIQTEFTSLDELLNYGIVAAWKCGMTEYRQHALYILTDLRLELLKTIFKLPKLEESNRVSFIENLTKDPWITPEDALAGNFIKNKFTLKKYSTFSGFGGHFSSPPEVEWNGRYTIASDNDNYYIVCSDIFGIKLKRISGNTYLELVEKKAPPSNKEVIVDGKTGTIQYKDYNLQFDELKNVSSYIYNDSTLCVTSPLSHSLFICYFKAG